MAALEPAVLDALRAVSSLRAVLDANVPGVSPQGAEAQKHLEQSLAGVLQSLQGVAAAATRVDAAIDTELLRHISSPVGHDGAPGTVPSNHPDALLLKQVQAVIDAHAVTVARSDTLQALVAGFDKHLAEAEESGGGASSSSSAMTDE